MDFETERKNLFRKTSEKISQQKSASGDHGSGLHNKRGIVHSGRIFQVLHRIRELTPLGDDTQDFYVS